MELGGLHHVTAVTGHAAENVRFYTQVLGLRLVKKTVNQDDVSAYHLFYGDKIGNAGTEVTFFDWPNAGPNVAGAGSISTIGLHVPDRDALTWWERRLKESGVRLFTIEELNGRPTLRFTDPEGQRLALVVNDGDREFAPWQRSPAPAEVQIQGLHHVTTAVERLAPTAWVLTEVLGFRKTGEYSSPENSTHQVTVFATGPGGPGAEVHVEEQPGQQRGRVGIGGVHHVAFRTPNDDEHQGWQQRIAQAGLGVTQVIDRYYFHSIYFREPGGVLFEIATDGPGFATDEDAARLGERLALPPFLEPRRSDIEAGLTPLPTGEGAASGPGAS